MTPVTWLAVSYCWMLTETPPETVTASLVVESIVTLTGKEVSVVVPSVESMMTLTAELVRSLTTPEKGSSTKTTHLESPDDTFAVPVCSEWTVKLADPVAGIETVCGTVTIVGSLVANFNVIELLSGGDIVVVIVPSLPGVNANWPGLKESFDDESVTSIDVVQPSLVVKEIVSAPDESAVISAVMLVSEILIFLMVTKPLLAVMDSVARRL